jgi:hypothetical protein
MKTCLSSALLQDLPSWVSRKLLTITRRAGLWSSSSTTSQKKSAHVYDLLNAGPRHRFTVVGDKNYIVSNCQSTGHDSFVLFLMQTMELRDRFEFYPWSADVHDAWYMEVREDQAEMFCQAVLDEVIPKWNNLLGGEIRLKAEPAIVTNLALDKLEGEALEKAKEYAKAQIVRLREQEGEGT